MHAVIRNICLIAAMSSVLVIFAIYPQNADETDLDCFSVYSNDSDIYVDWKGIDFKLTDTVIITIREVDKEFQIPAFVGGFHFRDGNHGDLYHVNISVQGLNEERKDLGYVERLFIVYNQLPTLPLLKISTYDGADPTYETADKPAEDLWGFSMKNNEYVSGQLSYQNSGQRDISAKMEIKCRGNTSSLGSPNSSYRIRMDDSYEFIQDYPANSDWVLLNSGNKLNFYVGNFLGQQCGMEWCPTGIFVNVMLNGDWKGTYYLTPQIGLESANGLIDVDGFIIENDAYWWKENELYFRTENQFEKQGFTFKYPKPSSESDDTFVSIQAYMQNVDYAIINNEYQNIIDESTFAKWILARDLIGSADGGGSNQYYYLKSLNDTYSKLKMGPLWDWDSAFLANEWSECRISYYSYYSYLFEYDTFNDIYRQEYASASINLIENLRSEFTNLNEAYGDEINKSWQLDAARWSRSNPILEELENSWLNWFESRISWMDRYVYFDFSNPSGEIDISSFSYEDYVLDISIDKEAYIDGWMDLYGFYTDEGGTNDNCYLGYVTSDDKLYIANTTDESSAGNQLVFDILTKSYGQICLIDLDENIIYREKLNYIDISDGTYQYHDLEQYNSNIESQTWINGVLTVYGYICSDEFDTDKDGMLLGYDVGGKIYFSEPIERKDVKDYYKCKTLKTGFNIKSCGKGKLCAVDINNRIIYEDIE